MSRWALLNFMTSQNRQHLLGRLIFPGAGTKRLVLLFAVSIVFTAWIKNTDATAGLLFQSPQSSPVEQPPAEQPPVQQPPAEQPPASQPAPEQPVEQPASQPAPAEQSPDVEAIPSESPLAEPDSETLIAPGEALPESIGPDDTGSVEFDVNEETEGGVRNFILDRVELIDTIVVSGAYIWLCCGVILFLLVPVFMLILYIRGRSKIMQEEGL